METFYMNTVFTQVLRTCALFVICTLSIFITAVRAETFTQNSASGIRDGMYFSFYKTDGSAEFTLEEPGRYTLKWDQSSEAVYGGIGWQYGSPAVIEYSGIFGNSGFSN
ncbi:MAG TPA: glycoside hydrolase family 11 protein, partial [Cellvibrionaceae bacterium]|nr:glycoside hydrolase family 11 protein [Cellvibrionaceae bacterium]